MNNDIFYIKRMTLRASILLPITIDFNNTDMKHIYNVTGFSFSYDFLKIYEYFPYDCFTIFEFLSMPYGVIEETMRLRKTSNLPLDTLCLSENDASILLMKCCGDHEEIYWIAIEDFSNYCEGKSLEYNPIIFDNFPKFFEYLLTEEEKIRKAI